MIIISHQENANQNHKEIYHLTLKDKRNMKKLECIANGNMKWCSCFGKQSGHFFKQLKTQLPTSIPLYTPKDIRNIGPQKDLSLNVYSSVIHNREVKQPNVHQLMNG